jgi:hypothetical protein
MACWWAPQVRRGLNVSADRMTAVELARQREGLESTIMIVLRWEYHSGFLSSMDR